MNRAVKVALPIAALATGLAGAAAAMHRATHRRDRALGRTVAGGVLVGDAARYDRLTGWLLGSFYDGVAADIAAALPPGASVLDVGCGPGHLTSRLAARGFDATGIDLDPAMIERAVARGAGGNTAVSYRAADVADLPFEDDSFDLVVSTLSMHHWTEAAAGLAEIGRVARPTGRVLIWDLGPGAPFHRHAPDPTKSTGHGPVEIVGAERWRWPGPLSLTQRIELRPVSAS
jgi:SAM-dependent methyltransferase